MRKLMIVILTLLAFAGSIYAQGWSCYGTGKVWIHKVGEDPVKINDNGQHAMFSKDGRLVFFNRGSDIYAVKNDGTGEKKLGTSGTGSGATFCAYRPEPQSVLVRDGSTYYKIDYATATRTLVATTNNGGLYGELAISNDGKRMAARLGGDLFKADISGTSATWSKYAGNCSASISPNGQKMTENGGSHKTMNIFNWGGGSSTANNTAGGTWDNQRFSVNSDDWISVLFDDRVGANQGGAVGAHQVSTNKTIRTGNLAEGSTQYPDFFFGDLPGAIVVQPTCTDGKQNGNETDVDCGGPDCPKCPDPTCTDGKKNGTETGVDCGGSCPKACPSGLWLDGGGYVIMEAEDSPSAKGEWAIKKDVVNYTGTGHIEMTGNNPSGAGQAPNSPQEYEFTITTGGVFGMSLRAFKRLDGAPGDQCNDGFIKVLGDYEGADGVATDELKSDAKMFIHGNSHNEWDWSHDAELPGHKPPRYNFKSGETYTFVLSGRSQRFNVDRIVFFTDAKESVAKDPATPQTISGSVSINKREGLGTSPAFSWTYNAITSGIEFSTIGLDNTEPSEMGIYDIHGKAIKSFDLNNGTYSWDGTDNYGQAVTKGVYLSVLKNGNNSVTKRLYVD